VVRPGSQVDAVVDTRQVPTAAAYTTKTFPPAVYPRVDFNRTDFWVQGVTFGLEWKY
jgi:hypothetical protein